MSRIIETARLALRPWSTDDFSEALSIYAAPAVRRWLTPDFFLQDDSASLQSKLSQWEHETVIAGKAAAGHWAIQRNGDSRVVGGASLQYPLHGESLTVSWALAPWAWGRGYAAEAGEALVRWAMHEGGVIEVFAIVQPENARAAATAQRIGMEWVTELGRLRNGRYQVYRIRHGDLAYRP